MYKNQGWISNSDWLGTKNISTHKKSFYSFEEARRFVQNLKIKNQAEWKRYSQSDEKPAEIPAAPERVYKNKGWIGLGDWLGTNRASNSNKEYLTYEMAKTFIHTLRLKDYKAWRKYCSTGNKPDYIPAFPDGVYKNKGWIGYGDWLGTNTQATFNRQYRSFKEAKKFVHTLGFKLRSDWRKYCINGNKPLDIPAAPDLKYKNEGWISWKDWFGCA